MKQVRPARWVTFNLLKLHHSFALQKDDSSLVREYELGRPKGDIAQLLPR